MVGKLERYASGIPTLQKMFTYYSAVTNFKGRGFLGFKGLGTTNWYASLNERVWNVATYHVDLRGAVTMDYSTTTYANFHTEPTDYIHKTKYQYDSSLLPNKVFMLNMVSSLEQNVLNGTHVNRDFEYDTYGNTLKAITNFSGQGEETVEVDYSNATSSSNYHIGRPLNKTTTTSIGGEHFYYRRNLYLQRVSAGTKTNKGA